MQNEERITLAHSGIPKDVALELVFSDGVIGYEVTTNTGEPVVAKERLSIADCLPSHIQVSSKVEMHLRHAMLTVARVVNLPEADAYRQKLANQLLDLVEPMGEHYLTLLRAFGGIVNGMSRTLSMEHDDQPRTQYITSRHPTPTVLH